MADVRDILELECPATPEVTKDSILGIRKDALFKKKKEERVNRRPEGMHRELYALLNTDSNKDLGLPPLYPAENQGYKSIKAKLGMKKVRPWKWMPFTNPARTDGAVLHHWRRVCDEGKEYPFAAFNKKLDIFTYTDSEYNELLINDTWTRNETDALFELCQQFDLRWYVIQDRWLSRFPKKSIEDLKERYYDVVNHIKKARSIQEGKTFVYDAEHERKRKRQLNRQYDRTPKQIEEEQQLLAEAKRIEARKKEREKKTQDLQKLISAADPNIDQRKNKPLKKKQLQSKVFKSDHTLSVPNVDACSGIKFPDAKTSGVSIRSQRMKLPINVGQKKVKVIEHMLNELNLETNPIPIEEVVELFNNLRSDIIVMYDLRTVLLNYVFELQTLKHQFEPVLRGRKLKIPEILTAGIGEDSPNRPRGISEMMDSLVSPNTPNRKRRAALEQGNVLKKVKART